MRVYSDDYLKLINLASIHTWMHLNVNRRVTSFCLQQSPYYTHIKTTNEIVTFTILGYV